MSAESLLSSLSDDARGFLGRIGRRFGTEEVQAQARQTLASHERFAHDLRHHGFADADRDRLVAALAAAAELSRDDIKVTQRDYVRALVEAKTARSRARSVLLSTYRRLRAGTEVGPIMDQMSAVISATAEPGGDDHVYAVHLERLREVLAVPQIAAAVADCGGPEADVMLADALGTLRHLDEANAGAKTLDADVIDGLIVELCRTAQFAAQSVARELNKGFIAGQFRLTKLTMDPAHSD